MAFASIYCIDGSGNQNAREADKKRPIYKLEVSNGEISRVLREDRSVIDYLSEQINALKKDAAILIAADLPIGLPSNPDDVYRAIDADSFLDWLAKTQSRLKKTNGNWRESLIAKAERGETRTPLMPFVSYSNAKEIPPDKTARRLCDMMSKGESVYCLDHGPKQVGKAALQFWFDVLIDLQTQFTSRVAVWPFENTTGKQIVVAECYPAFCQRMVFQRMISKRDPLQVSKALIGLTKDVNRNHGISIETWIHAASSEDEFDMFTAALAFREKMAANEDLLKCPDNSLCRTYEGWMLGLDESSLKESVTDNHENTSKQKNQRSSARHNAPAVPVGDSNRNDQMNLGPSGARGPKGPLTSMKCYRKRHDGTQCGYEYETNAQDVFQKKCPICQL